MGKSKKPKDPIDLTSRADSIPQDELIPKDVPVFFPPYVVPPATPATVPASHVDPEFKGESEPSVDGEKPSPAAASAEEEEAPPSPQQQLSPKTFEHPPEYVPTEEVQTQEAEALKEFDALIKEEHPGVDDKTTPTGPLPPHCDAEQFAIARDLARLRFLRARKFDIKAAVEQYVNTIKWREEDRVDTILDHQDPAEPIYHCVCPHRNHGFDRFGHPIYYEKTGGVRMPKFMKHLTEDDLVRRHVRMMEHTIRRGMYSSAVNGRNVEKMVIIMDMADMEYTIDGTGLRVFKRTSKIDEQFYPERLFKMFIINAPFSFRGVWAMVRPWLDPKTKDKITVVGGNYMKHLTPIIDPDQIPETLGGNSRFEYPNGDKCIQLPREYPDPDVVGGWHKVFENESSLPPEPPLQPKEGEEKKS